MRISDWSSDVCSSDLVKTHEVPPHGKIARLFGYEGYGFIETPDGREIYFHQNSLVDDDFEKLEEGQEVRSVAAEGERDKGPQPSPAQLIGKHHLTSCPPPRHRHPPPRPPPPHETRT